MNSNYRVSLSHANRTSIKTDAPPDVVWDLMRQWVKEHPIKQDRLKGVAAAILSKEPVSVLNMELRADANPESREKGLARFQENPQRFWGPGMRSRSK